MTLATYVDTLNLLGDESRLRLCALLRDRELCVSDLVRVTGISQSRVSAHLGRMREAGLVRDRRQGPQTFYALGGDALPPSARALLDEAVAATDAILDGDRERLRALESERAGGLHESFAGEMERHYSPGRTWPALCAGLAALLDLGDVLDVGSGDGAAVSLVAPRCRSLTCLDRSERMIEAARARFADHDHVRCLVGDAAALPFPKPRFDAALLFHTLAYADEPAAVVREVARVLRPGGRLVVLTLDEHDQSALTAPFGERHPGFSPARLRKLLARAPLTVESSAVACREPKKPHFSVVLAVARKPENPS